MIHYPNGQEYKDVPVPKEISPPQEYKLEILSDPEKEDAISVLVPTCTICGSELDLGDNTSLSAEEWIKLKDFLGSFRSVMIASPDGMTEYEQELSDIIEKLL